jgi:hypothetical protein
MFCAALSHGKSCALILAKNGVGYILGEFFTNSSGHPARFTIKLVCITYGLASDIFEPLLCLRD